MKHKVINGQSVLDVCVQTYGTTDRLLDFCAENDINPTANLQDGDLLNYQTASEWADKNVANIINGEDCSEGIAFRRININFKLQ